MTTRSQRAPSRLHGKAQSQRGSPLRHHVLVSTMALFGKVSADRTVRSVFHKLGYILGWAGILIRDQLLSLQWFLCSLWKSALERPPWTGPEKWGSPFPPSTNHDHTEETWDRGLSKLGLCLREEPGDSALVQSLVPLTREDLREEQWDLHASVSSCFQLRQGGSPLAAADSPSSLGTMAAAGFPLFFLKLHFLMQAFIEILRELHISLFNLYHTAHFKPYLHFLNFS